MLISIFKTEKERTFKPDKILEKNIFIVEGLGKKLSFSEIAKKENVSKQNIHERFSRVCVSLEEFEPKLVDLYTNFDTTLDLTLVINNYWLGFVARLVLLRNNKVFLSNTKEYLIVTVKLQHKKVHIKKGDYFTISSPFLQELRGKLPVKVESFAQKLGVNPTKLQDFLEDIFSSKVYIIDDYILSVQKGSIFNAIRLYCTSEEISYDGTLKELYKKFSKYENVFKQFKITNYKEFYNHLNSQMFLYAKFLEKDKNTKRYEVKNYLKKTNSKEKGK